MTRRSIFDTVRRMLGRGFSQSEVDVLDRALDEAGQDFAQDRVQSVPSCGVSPAGIQLIKSFEGCARLRSDGLYEAYPDPGTGGTPWTIGWGATGPDIGPGTLWPKAKCDERLETDIARHARDVAREIGGAPTSQAQFDALVSFHYNTGAIHRASLTRFHKQGEYALAAEEFGRWKYAGGQVLKGLVRRRREEAKLYRSCGLDG
ncbi:lysozyme [Qipengyuania sphaerica]|uniref:lysozyme n=1 Tax=Qipengyuania sphaerica TaxID=2867243 RepID=UPI001C86C0D4|nr:lysozyme [Qipengyuania sphaerica]MBX7539998.1 lysozyme [Qipengyuania sphaerica]